VESISKPLNLLFNGKPENTCFPTADLSKFGLTMLGSFKENVK
jgi:hypothetical protein